MYYPTYYNKGIGEPVVTYEIKTPSTGNVVSVDDLKAYMRVDYSDDDALIADLGRAAEMFTEKQTGWAIGTKTITVYSDSYGVGWLPLIPVMSTGIDKINRDQFNTTTGSVDMIVGYTSANLPQEIKLAIMKIVATAYENREDNIAGEARGLMGVQIPGNSDILIRDLKRRIGI